MKLLNSRTACRLGSLTLSSFAVLAVITWQMGIRIPVPLASRALLCHADFTRDGELTCRPKCDRGFYSLPQMDNCQPWLTCQQILSEDFKTVKTIGAGLVKAVHLAKYRGQEVTYSTLKQQKYRGEISHSLKMLTAFQPSVYVPQLIGYCEDNYVTEYHKLGNMENLERVLKKETMTKYDTLRTRFKLCVNYVEIINFLHSTPEGARVMCDSNNVKKVTGQFLLTSDLNLVVNDLDALPLVNHTLGTTVKCGSRRLYGDFVAPEQLWPLGDKEFDDNLLPGYDEKTDIWKIPSVCEFFLGRVQGSEDLKNRLSKIHKSCKNLNPSQRPPASELLHEYTKIQQLLGIL